MLAYPTMLVEDDGAVIAIEEATGVSEPRMDNCSSLDDPKEDINLQ